MTRAVLLAGVLAVAVAAPAVTRADPGDPTGPALVALALRHGAGALPSVADLLIGLPTNAGVATVCGRVTYEGLGHPARRFVAFVDEPSRQHRDLARVRLETMPGFDRDWTRHCVVGLS
jgi:hypothetical protein